MSEAYKTEPGRVYFLTCTVVSWIDLFIRRPYIQIVADSLTYCMAHKGLELYAACLMPSHLHLVAGAHEKRVTEIIRDFKRHTAKALYGEIKSATYESRRTWMLDAFEAAGRKNPQNEGFQLWQQDNHPIWLESREVVDQKFTYLYDNPVKAGFVAEPHHYLLSTLHPQCPIRPNRFL